MVSKDKIKEILEKIKHLKDLRLALTEIKNNNLHKSEESGLKHKKTVNNLPGILTHILESPSGHEYHIEVDTRKLADKEPSHCVCLAKKNEFIMSPKVHKNIQGAIKDIVHHFHTGKWHGQD